MCSQLLEQGMLNMSGSDRYSIYKIGTFYVYVYIYIMAPILFHDTEVLLKLA